MFNYISSYVIKKRHLANNEMEYEKSLLFDVYTLVLVFILVCNFLLNLVYLEQPVYAAVFLGMGAFMLCTIFWSDRIRFNKYLLMILFMFLGLVVFYCDIVSGKDVMNYLSYVSLTIAVAFFFDSHKERYLIFILVGTYMTFFLINIVTDYSILPSLHQDLSETKQWYVRVYKAIEIVLCTFIGMYFIHRKEKMIIKYYIEKEKINDLVKKTDKIDFSNDLFDLAISQNSLFLTYFKSQFPDYFDNILQKCPNLISTELELCALLKLNLSTKDIAVATNSTIRAVENKKYRIRRKFNLSSETDLNLYMINSF
ncbi:helix-turn-helix transcriptional regulator [Chryseobacterium sp. MIQD13]|uniref:helix-turn-helix transcriptional regulator n=1 Tax=Chryseobacterium sp. MIQD13 TaxID=3422310 RepID=UPI003D2A9535